MDRHKPPPPRDRVTRWLADRRVILAAVCLAVLAALPSLASAPRLDDAGHLAFVRAQLAGESDAHWWDMFVLLDGNRALALARRDVGTAPWWLLPEARIAFFRPASVLTHYVDGRLWPSAPWAMHLHSLAWMAVVCALAGSLSRRVEGGPVAGLAVLLFAVDDTHADPSAWLADRHALVATTFGYASVLAHDRWRRAPWRPGAIFAPAALALSLLASEMGLCAFAFTLAYALTLDPGRPLARVVSLLPAISIVGAWRLVYAALGYGAHGSGGYLDPSVEPGLFLGELPGRIGALLVGHFAAGPELAARLGPAAIAASAGAGLLAAALVAGCAWSAHRDPRIRFWLLALVLGLLPVTAAPPSPRLLFFTSLPAAVLLARTIEWAALARVRAAGAAFLLATRLLLGPVSLGWSAAGPATYPAGYLSTADALGDDESLRREEVFVVNTPAYPHALAIPRERARQGKPWPARIWVLGSTFSPIELSRPEERTLELACERGWLEEPFAANWRDTAHPLAVGEIVRLPGHQIEVRSVTPDGRPDRLRLQLDRPLESARWLTWDGRDYRRVELPAVGGTLQLPGLFGE